MAPRGDVGTRRRDATDATAGARSDPAGIRVLLVDDHPGVRQGLAERLSIEDDVTVVGECENGAQVVEAAARLDPDIVCMDLSMPVMDGFAASEALREAGSTSGSSS